MLKFTMKFTSLIKKSIPFLIVLTTVTGVQFVHAQLQEPEVRDIDQPRTPYGEGYRNSISFNVLLNNFGFGIGGEYTKIVGPYTELTFRTGITGLRDVSEQNFQDFFTGQRIIPNKYKRGFAFPFLIGIQRRLFAEAITDNFRFYVSGAAGPSLAFTYPYVNDVDGNGFRTRVLQRDPFTGRLVAVPAESINDFFSGWSDGETHWGFNGELKIGVALGENFGRQTKLEFGYFFYYFKEGLEIMEPYQSYGFDPDTGLPIEVNEDGERNRFFAPKKYFGTPQFTITFGGLW